MRKKPRCGGAPADLSASGPLLAKAETTASGRRGGIRPGSHLAEYSSRTEDKIRRLLLGPSLQPDGDFTLLITTHDLEAYCVADGVVVKPAQEPRDAVDRAPVHPHDHVSWPNRSV